MLACRSSPRQTVIDGSTLRSSALADPVEWMVYANERYARYQPPSAYAIETRRLVYRVVSDRLSVP